MTMREDNASPLDSVSAISGSSTTTTDNSGFAPQLPSSAAASSSSSSSNSASASTNHLTHHEQQQVEQYKDDIMLHTQLQLQLYLEDLEEAETAAEIQAHIDQAAFAESLVNSAHALDPLQDSLLPSSPHGAFGGGSGGLLSPDVTQMFQQQMMSLESNALAAAAADATASEGFLHHGGGGLGGVGVGGGLSEHAHDRREDLDLDWADDDDDEDCLPPSETKYILYDDHVSPAGFFGSDNSHLQEDTKLRCYGDEASDDNGCDEEGSCGEENKQGRPSHRRGPDIYINLAGTILSPINIHDIFFSQFYSRLVYLNLWDTNLGIWGAQAVGGLMADRVCRIQYLNLGSNRLNFEGIVQLAGLYKNQSLIELDLSENQLGPKAIHSLQQTMVRLQKDKACNIRRLNLSNNDINDVGCISIAKIILGTSIVQLDLSFNKISDWGASTILAAFESNELTLKEINMEANPLTFAGGENLCKILVLPQSRITHLDLRGAKVTDVGIPYLAKALQSHHCPIVSLNLYDCQLTDTGISRLAIKLSVNRSLRVLGLGRNSVGDMGVIALSQVLCINSCLEELDLSDNEVEFSRAGLEAMMAAMRTNTSLLDLRLSVEQDNHLMAGNEGTGLYMDQPFHQQQQQYYQNAASVAVETQYYPQEELPTLSGPAASVNQVGEVLAPTYAALALPLQVPANAPDATPTTTATVTALPPPPALPVVMPPVTAATQEESLARDRRQAARAQSALKTYVRHNHKRTGNMRKLCFEILAVARVLMFAKDDPRCYRPVSRVGSEQDAGLTMAVRPSTLELILGAGSDSTIISTPDTTSSGASAESTSASSLISLQTGLPTPPLTSESKPPPASTHSTTDQQPDLQQPRASLACLPWELKEMILRGLDPEGLLSERQFQAVMQYSGTRWETVRQPWERWGEIREMILETTGCYYYEG
ncbi:NACHT, LRR and PYD domains-containing protein 3 [Mortierella sp. 14UC]|nr:NACHT, LRR and PYD domains-containing protein 3 [Mortierella sp. 14UC]